MSDSNIYIYIYWRYSLWYKLRYISEFTWQKWQREINKKTHIWRHYLDIFTSILNTVHALTSSVRLLDCQCGEMTEGRLRAWRRRWEASEWGEGAVVRVSRVCLSERWEEHKREIKKLQEELAPLGAAVTGEAAAAADRAALSSRLYLRDSHSNARSLEPGRDSRSALRSSLIQY